MNLNQISLPAVDLAASIKFYCTLKLKLIVRTDVYARFELPEGEATLSLYKADTVQPHEGIHVYFECEKLDERVRELESNGIVFESAPVDQRWLWREAWLKDPAGNSLCLYHANSNRKYPPWRIE